MNSDPAKTLKRNLLKECAKAVAAGHYPLVVRAQAECTNDFDPLSWLASQKEYPKFFWQNAEGGRVMAYAGAAHIFTNSDRACAADQWDSVRRWLERVPGLRCWCGGAFNNRITGQEWSDFDAWAMYIPKFGIERDPANAKWHLVCQLILPENDDGTLNEAVSLLERLSYSEDHSLFTPDILALEESPSYEDWQKTVNHTLETIARNEISKVVLARCMRLTLDHAVAPEAVMARLLQNSNQGFMCLPAPLTGFLSVSPELLYHRRRDRLDTFAIAGTRPRGHNELEDRLLKAELAGSVKDKLEHQQVVDMLAGKLAQLCILAKLDGKSTLLELPNQRHFYQRLRGRLLEGVTDELIIRALHPTPAVGGVPADKALKLIASAEPFDRGWFAGTVGWLSRDEAQMAVGIRSCLIRQDQWYVYGGAGIVDGSRALAEWEEIGLKMKNILDVLHAR
ncbi:MAG: isochorismate synthase [Candidatus Omnitrophica bacterium]|nr:isochorismate synthase [Candidatus Omnitrophota bacterium]